MSNPLFTLTTGRFYLGVGTEREVSYSPLVIDRVPKGRTKTRPAVFLAIPFRSWKGLQLAGYEGEFSSLRSGQPRCVSE